jgi:Rrf2 family protein
MAALLGVSQKCQYALRALFELALRYRSGNVSTVADVAARQFIPARFLEQIFAKLKSGGYITSRRGKQGGYLLALAPDTITVGAIIRFIEGSEETIDCLKPDAAKRCPLSDGCVLSDMWRSARGALDALFDATTLQDLVDRHRSSKSEVNYSI